MLIDAKNGNDHFSRTSENPHRLPKEKLVPSRKMIGFKTLSQVFLSMHKKFTHVDPKIKNIDHPSHPSLWRILGFSAIHTSLILILEEILHNELNHLVMYLKHFWFWLVKLPSLDQSGCQAALHSRVENIKYNSQSEKT